MMDMFIPIVDDTKLHPSFKAMSTGPYHQAARRLMNEIFTTYEDKDGNFLEQFQTSGFDQRTFELFLFTYFMQGGYSLDQSNPAPDFLIANQEGVTVAIEATTANSSATQPKQTETFEEEFQRKILHELPTVFGSSLYSKLNHEHDGKKYWELPQCKGKPFVIALQTFHEQNSLAYPDAGLATFLYGLQPVAKRTDGSLVVKFDRIEEHQRENKAPISSSFFDWPECENISAVMFCNTGSVPKFNRMGCQEKYHDPKKIKLFRFGECYDHNEQAHLPMLFEYDVENPPIKETWGQGISVFLNPRAKVPLSPSFFKDATHYYLIDGELVGEPSGFHPFNSVTEIVDLERPPHYRVITHAEFRSYGIPSTQLGREIEWFRNPLNQRLGVVIQDRTDKDFAIAVFEENKLNHYELAVMHASIETLKVARSLLITALNAD